MATSTLALFPPHESDISPPFIALPTLDISSVSGTARLVFQNDGNLVVYDEANRARWASNTAESETSNPGRRCVFQDDGNLVVYDSNGVALWASGTQGHPHCLLFIQNDGNVVIYDPYPTAIWATGTNH